MPSCNIRGPNPQSWLSCLGMNVAFDETKLAYYANIVNSPKGETYNYVISCLAVRRIIYAKGNPGYWPEVNSANVTGNCPKEDSGIPSSQRVTGIAGAASSGLGTASTLVSGALSTALGIASFGAGLLTIPLAIIARHAQAVKNEQTTLCAVSQAYNAFASNVEAELTAGKITADEAYLAAIQLREQLFQATRMVRKECNFGCEMEKAIDALIIYNKEVIFPQLESGIAKRVVSSTAGKVGLVVTGIIASFLISK